MPRTKTEPRTLDESALKALGERMKSAEPELRKQISDDLAWRLKVARPKRPKKAGPRHEA